MPPEGPVHARLVAAAASGDVLFHGSNDRTIDVFEPREPRQQVLLRRARRPANGVDRGAVYVLPRTTFEPSDVAAEWISFAPVVPLEAEPVTQGDFPFARRVFRFEHPESDWRRLGGLVANGVADAFGR